MLKWRVGGIKHGFLGPGGFDHWLPKTEVVLGKSPVPLTQPKSVTAAIYYFTTRSLISLSLFLFFFTLSGLLAPQWDQHKFLFFLSIIKLFFLWDLITGKTDCSYPILYFVEMKSISFSVNSHWFIFFFYHTIGSLFSFIHLLFSIYYSHKRCSNLHSLPVDTCFSLFMTPFLPKSETPKSSHNNNKQVRT